MSIKMLTSLSKFLKLLAEKNRNICCVGDDDHLFIAVECEIKNFLNLIKYMKYKVIRLEENYRSTQNILS